MDNLNYIEEVIGHHFNEIFDLILIIDRDLKIHFIKDQTKEKLLGSTGNKLENSSLTSIIGADSVKSVKNAMESVPNRITIPFLSNEGKSIWFSTSIVKLNQEPFQDAFLLTCIMIDSLKKEKEQLEGSERKYRLITENVRDLVSVLDDQFRLVFISNSVKEISGFTREEVLCQNPNEYVHPDDLGKMQTFFRKVMKDGIANVQIRQRRKDGIYRLLDVKAKFVKDDTLKGFIIVVSRDVTEQEEIAISLKASEEKYRHLFEAIPFFVLLLDLDGTIIDTNPACKKVVGYMRNDLIGKKYKDLNIVDKEMLPQLLERLNKFARNGIDSVPYIDVKLKKKTGEKMWISFTSSLVKTSTQTFIQVIGIDVTESKKLDQLKEEEIQKLKKLDQMRKDIIMTVVHELKTPLTSIMGASEFLLNIESDCRDESQQEILDLIGKGGKRLSNLVTKLLDITRLEYAQFALELSNTDLPALFSEIIEEMSYLIKMKFLDVKIDIPESLNLNVDKNRMEQVIINLLSNAIKNTPSHGKINIDVKEDNNLIKIRISDTGIGLTDEELRLIFTQFGKLKREKELVKDIDIRGTGLGLFITKKIVELHNGKIWAESEGRNKGATFTVQIPR